MTNGINKHQSPQDTHKATKIIMPLVIPLGASGIASFIILLMAIRVYRASECRLPLPWSEEHSLAMLHAYYPSAWGEVVLIKRLSSACAAALHADIASAFLFVAAVAMFCGLISVCFSDLFRLIAINANRATILKGAASLYICRVAFFGVVCVFSRYGAIVNNDNELLF
jgi:hypothetical protein